jgi:signal transduction histidine kinase
LRTLSRVGALKLRHAEPGSASLEQFRLTWGNPAPMSIRLRFTLALTAVGVLLFGTYALWGYFSEREDLRTAASREIAIVGRSLETALGNALRDQQGGDIHEILASLEALAPSLGVYARDPNGRMIAHSQRAVVDIVIEELLDRSAHTRTEITTLDPADDPTRLVFTAPLLAEDGALLGTVAVARPINDLEDDLARTRDRLIAMVGVFLFATIAAGMVLGSIHVTRPIARLLDGVRHVRAGNFRTQVRPGRADEIGQLVDEFNAMIGALAEERARAETEAEARARLERGLQRVDKLVTVGQLSAGLAHEIGSPLQVLSGRASVLVAHTDPEVRRQAEQLVAQCGRITEIVEQLLSFGRRKAAVIAPCDVVVPVRAVIDLLGGEARRRGVALSMEVDGRAHEVNGDRDQIQQVALNLIRNALAATPRDGQVTVRVDRAHELVRLCVRDNGSGIDPDARARLFEPFFTTRASEGGTGLGLAVVRAIADEHRAQVDVRSEPAGGAEFIVSFPARLEVSGG